MEDRLDLPVACDIGALADVHAAIAAFSARHGLTPTLTHNLDVIADEIISNIIRHGFVGNERDRRIHLTVEPSADGVRMNFTDTGRPFDPTKDAPPPDLTSTVEDREVGGLGIHIVSSLAARMTYVRQDDENRLEVVVRT